MVRKQLQLTMINTFNFEPRILQMYQLQFYKGIPRLGESSLMQNLAR